ncbi:MAG: insulinase family protein, partial [Actinobacteria bacterium]|nr:insulinase family protein [Actinomycetota bacterium]
MSPTATASKRPALGAPPAWDFPKVNRNDLDNGLKVLSAHSPGQLLATAQIVIDAGAQNEVDGQYGAANLAVRSLLEGTERHKGPAFANALESLGAQIGVGCNWDTFRVNLTAPRNRMETAMELLAEAVLTPEFPTRDVDRLRDQRMAGVLQDYSSAASRASIAFDRAAYTSDSAYYRPAHGSYWSVAQLGKKAIKKYYDTMATPGSSALVVVGDLDEYPLAKIGEKLFGGWKGKEAPRPELVVRGTPQQNTVILVDRVDAEQSHLMIGHIGVSRLVPEYTPLVFVATALGGLFGSRLNMKLREEKGYTYGITSSFDFRRQAGPFRISTAVDTDVTIDAIADVVEVLQGLRDGG